MEDVAETGLVFMAQYPSLRAFIQADSRPYYKKIDKLFETGPQAVILTRAANERIGIVAEKLSTGFIQSVVSDELSVFYKVLQDSFLTNYNGLLLRKHSIYTPAMNKLVMRATEIGLTDKWGSDCIITQNRMKQQMFLKEYGRGISKLDLSQLVGAFALWAGGLTLSFLMYLIEFVVYKLSKYRSNV